MTKLRFHCIEIGCNYCKSLEPVECLVSSGRVQKFPDRKIRNEEPLQEGIKYFYKKDCVCPPGCNENLNGSKFQRMWSQEFQICITNQSTVTKLKISCIFHVSQKVAASSWSL